MKRKLVTLGLTILVSAMNVLPACAAETPYATSMGIEFEDARACKESYSPVAIIPIAVVLMDDSNNVVDSRPGIVPLNYYDPNRQIDDYSVGNYYINNVSIVPSERAGYQTLKIEYLLNTEVVLDCDWNVAEYTGPVVWSFKCFGIIDLNNGTILNQKQDEEKSTTYTQNGKTYSVYTKLYREQISDIWRFYGFNPITFTELDCYDYDFNYTIEIDTPVDYDISQMCLYISKGGEKDYSEYLNSKEVDETKVDIFGDEAYEIPSDYYFFKISDFMLDI